MGSVTAMTGVGFIRKPDLEGAKNIAPDGEPNKIPGVFYEGAAGIVAGDSGKDIVSAFLIPDINKHHVTASPAGLCHSNVLHSENLRILTIGISHGLTSLPDDKRDVD